MDALGVLLVGGCAATAGTLTVAAAGKLAAPWRFDAALRSGGFAPITVTVARRAVPTVELGLAFGIAATRGTALAITLSLTALLLAAFSAWMVWVISRGIQASCACFGSSTSPVGWRGVARNGAWIVLVVICAVLAGGGHAGSWPAISAGYLAAVIGTMMILGALTALRIVLPSLVLTKSQLARDHEGGGG